MKYLFILLCFFIAPQAYAFPLHHPIAGGLLVYDIADSQQYAKPSAWYRGLPVTIINHNNRWVLVAGVPLKASGIAVIDIDIGGQKIKQEVTLEQHDYPEQRITIKNKRKVNPNTQDNQRISREFLHLKKIKTMFSDRQPQLTMQRPASGPESSQFGLKRFFNGQARNPHSGLDIAAAKGEPILAPAPGVVIDTGDYFFNGGSVYLDHGQGVISLFAHMSAFNVSVGDWVDTGQKLGEVGSTGRSTGPHLHWTVYVGQTSVDPKLLLDN